MKNHIQNIELINKYLDRLLSENEIIDFENQLKTDVFFKEEYEAQVIFLEGLKRQALKAEIKKAKQSYVKNKWFKFFGIGIMLIALSAIVYFNVFNSDKAHLKSKLNFESEYIQSFQVIANSIIEIVGEKGTVIQFNPEDLETASNKPFIGDSLIVELIELTTKQDLLLANAQTVSNGKWLISGGAFKIDIKSNGEHLILKKGKTIDAQFSKNTEEENMEVFYGKRDIENKMNWDLSDIKLVEQAPYYCIFYEQKTIIDRILTKRYGVDTMRDLINIDSLGYMFLKDLSIKFPQIRGFNNQKDTLRILKRFIYKEAGIDDLEMDEALIKTDSTITELIKREDFDKIRKWSKNIDGFDVINEESAQLFVNSTKNFYKSVEVSKLGWINIDKYIRQNKTINIKFNFNVRTSYDELYIIDQKSNTIVNVYNEKIDLPINRSFYIIAIGIKGKDIYSYKKSVRFSESQDFNISYKKVNESQIKSIMTIE